MSSLPFTKVLAVGAHCDDIEIGCGGTLHRLAGLGVPVYGLIITDTHYKRDDVVHRDGNLARKEAESAAAIIGYQPIFGNLHNNDIVVNEYLVYLIRDVIEKHNIDTVFTHWDGDTHLDHQKVSQASVMATRDTRHLFMYRSNRFKGTNHYSANLSMDIPHSWQAKKKALQCYQSELDRIGQLFIDFADNSNRCEGIASGTQYAELFLCVKSLF